MLPAAKIRLKEVAEAAGVSQTTASLALADNPRISRETRERVRAIAAKLGYRPVAAAQALRGLARERGEVGFQGTIGHLVYPHEMAMVKAPDGPTRFPWVFAVSERATGLGYSVDHFLVEDDRRGSKRLGEILKARGIRGLLISAKHDDLTTLQFDWAAHCAISLSASPSIQFLTDISIPFFQDTYTAIVELWRRGYRRIGFIMVGNVLDQFLAGYQSAVHRTGLPMVPPLISAVGVPAQLDAWIRKHKLDAILTTTGMELFEAIRDTGRDVPGDIGLCCVDDIDAPGFLSGLHQPRTRIASLAVDMLHLMIQRNEVGVPSDPMEIHIPSSWTEGHTLLPEIGVSATRKVRRPLAGYADLDKFVRRYHPT